MNKPTEESGAEGKDILGGKLTALLRLVARWTSSCLLFCLPDDDVGLLPRPAVRGALTLTLALSPIPMPTPCTHPHSHCQLTYARHMCLPALGSRRCYHVLSRNSHPQCHGHSLAACCACCASRRALVSLLTASSWPWACFGPRCPSRSHGCPSSQGGVHCHLTRGPLE